MNSSSIHNRQHTVLANLFNYGVYCIGFIGLYIFLAVVLQALFGWSDIVSTAVANIVMLCLSIILFCRRAYRKIVPSFQSYGRNKMKNIVSWYVYLVLISYACLTFFNWINANFVDSTMESRVDSMSDIPILALLGYTIILAPVVEECMIRLFMYNQLRRSSHWIVSMLITSFVFAILHGTISHLIIGSIFAISLTIAYENTRCILVPIFGHVTYNVMSLFWSSYNTDNIYVLLMFICVILSIVLSIVKLNVKMKYIAYRDM